MPTYIEKEALLKVLSKYTEYGDDGNQEIDADIVFLTIKEFPATDVATVKHGEWTAHWIPCDEDLDGYLDGRFECTECLEVSDEKSNHCPNCGAIMLIK